MTTLDLNTFPESRSTKLPSFATRLATLWQAIQRRRAERTTLARLHHLDARTLIDMGFDPAEIYASRVGTWREEHGDAWKGLK